MNDHDVNQLSKSALWVNFSVIMLTVWVLFSAWQMQNLAEQNLKLKQQLVRVNFNQERVVNQAILTAFAEYNFNHNMKATNFWLTVALKNTNKMTHPLCKAALLNLIKQTENAKVAMHLKQDLHLRLNAILASIDKKNDVQDDSADELVNRHSLVSLFKKHTSSLEREGEFIQLKKLLKITNEKLLELSNQDLREKLDQAINLVIKAQAVPSQANQASSIFTQLKAMQDKLITKHVVFASLAYCNNTANKVTIADFSDVKFKKV